MSSNIRIPSSCKYCNRAFVARTTVTQFCSTDCAKKAYKKRKRDEKIQKKLKQEVESKKVVSKSDNISSKDYLDKEFLCVGEVASLLGVSRWTIQRLIKNKKISSSKIGVKTIVAMSSVRNLFS